MQVQMGAQRSSITGSCCYHGYSNEQVSNRQPGGEQRTETINNQQQDDQKHLLLDQTMTQQMLEGGRKRQKPWKCSPLF